MAWKDLVSELLIIQDIYMLRKRIQDSENVIVWKSPRTPQATVVWPIGFFPVQNCSHLATFSSVYDWESVVMRFLPLHLLSLCRDSGIMSVMAMPARWRLELLATDTPSLVAAANAGRDLERAWRGKWLSSDTTRNTLDKALLYVFSQLLSSSSDWLLSNSCSKLLAIFMSLLESPY